MFILDESVVRRKYSFRCESLADALIIRTLLARWIIVWIEKPAIDPTYPDIQVTFGVRDEAPDTYVLRQIVNTIEDCQVAAETLEESSAYTGVRRDVLETITENDLIVEVGNEAEDTLTGLSERVAESINVFKGKEGEVSSD